MSLQGMTRQEVEAFYALVKDALAHKSYQTIRIDGVRIYAPGAWIGTIEMQDGICYYNGYHVYYTSAVMREICDLIDSINTALSLERRNAPEDML